MVRELLQWRVQKCFINSGVTKKSITMLDSKGIIYIQKEKI